MRAYVAVALLAVAFGTSLIFRGTNSNLVVLAATVAAIMAALTSVGPTRLAQVASSNRAAAGLWGAWLVYLMVCYRTSLSPDSSFAASWVLAALPLTYAGVAAIVRHTGPRRALICVLFVGILGLALISSVRFLAWGERAQAPLVDPNNYATLMYLAWIPLVHRDASSAWSGRGWGVLGPLGSFSASFLLVLAIVATRSRTALIIVFGCLVIWLGIALVRRVALRPLLLHAGAVFAAWLVGYATTALTDAQLKAMQFGGGLEIRAELVRSAWQMWQQHPLGVGVFCFPLLYPSLRSTAEQDTAGLFVHNDYLQFLVEGGVPLLVLLLVFVALVVRRTLHLVRLPPHDESFARAGFGIAIAVASAHAMVNFVYYSLPLDIIVGTLAALLFAPRAAEARSVSPAISPRAPLFTAGVLGLGWLVWMYLVLDVAIVGVFQGQPTFGLTASIRSDPQRMLEFARVSQKLNGNRGIPVFGEAVLLYRAAEAEPASRYLPDTADAAFRRALAVDPWNTMTYVRYAEFRQAFPQAGRSSEAPTSEDLLLSSIGIDPVFVPAIDALTLQYLQTGNPTKAYALLRNVVYPWLRILRRNDPAACDRYLDELEAYARATQDTAFLGELAARRIELGKVEPRRAASG